MANRTTDFNKMHEVFMDARVHGSYELRIEEVAKLIDDNPDDLFKAICLAYEAGFVRGSRYTKKGHNAL